MPDEVKTSIAAPHVKTRSLICGSLVTTDLKRARRLYEEAFDMECVEPEKGLMYVRERGHRPGEARHGTPYWVLEVREVETVEVPQEMLNHWGFDAPSQAAIDEAYANLSANKAEYGLTRVQKPFFRNGSYAIYCVDKDSNWWEVEYRAPELQYTTLREKGDQVFD
jgi:catechol 2,3-dioxygenase-like lactoylglutathione lyase family enzyme